jgi:hypothetical protein
MFDHDHARQRAIGGGRRTPAHDPSDSPERAQLIFLQAAVGNRAVALFVARSNGDPPGPPMRPPRTEAQVLRDLRRVGAEINARRSVAADLVEARTGHRPERVEDLVAELGRIAEREGEDSAAARLHRELGRLVRRRDGLLAEGRALRGGSAPAEFKAPEKKTTEASSTSKSTAPHKTAEGSTASKATATADKPATKAAAEAGVIPTRTKGGGTATKAIEAEAKAGARGARLGRFGLAMLLPGPEDAILLMAQFAGSYEEAWEAIEQRNARDGIAFGIAAGMMGLDWPWVTENLWRRFVMAGLEEQILGAVGKAEASFNDGLRRGHRYGAGHPQRMKSEYLREAFALLADKGYKTTEEGLFTLDTVARVASVFMPVADDFLRQAAERKEAREQKVVKEAAKEARAGNRV